MKERKSYLDILNIFATLAVVILHSTQIVFKNRFDTPWMISSVLQSLFIWAVPVFVMISGANLLSYRSKYSTSTFMKKRLKKVLIPFLFWSVIWYLYNAVQFKYMPSLRGFIYSFAFNDIQNIFWFFYVIVGLYLITPVLSVLTQEQYLSLIKYILIGYFIIVGVIYFIFPIAFKKNIPTDIYGVPLLSNAYVGYFVLGWYLENGKLSERIKNILIFIGFVVGIFATIFISVYSVHVNYSFKFINSYTGFPVILFALSIYIGIKKLARRITFSLKMEQFLARISSCSLGVYVIHLFFIQLFDSAFHIASDSLVQFFIVPLVVYIISMIVIYVLKRIPGVSHIVP